MSVPPSVELQVPPEHSPADLALSLERALGLEAAEPAPAVLTYYDSFDWRFYREGYELALEPVDVTYQAIFGGTDGSRFEVLETPAPPRFARDLPPGKWSARFADVLEMRALLPRVELRGERRELRLRDEAGSVLVDFVLEAYAVDPISMSPRLRLTPARGYRKGFRQLLERLRLDFGLEAAAASQLSEALPILGLPPEDPSALPQTPIDPELRADMAAKRVLQNLLHTVRVNEPGVRAETDTEFLHDYRVAVRRTRSALAQIKHVFPERVARRFSRRFAKLARMTSDARDLDVYLLDFDRHRAALPATLAGGLEPLHDLLRRRAGKAHARFNRYLASPSYKQLMTAWDQFLSTPPPRRPRARGAGLPIGELAGRRIWTLFRRVVKAGTAITPESPPAELHTLRKTAKKLRYLMELFRSLYPPDKIAPLVKILKSLQDHLGEYQDVQVQITHLLDFSAELRQAGAPLETLLALGALLDRLYTREQALRDGFGDCFDAFAEETHRRKFRQLFKPETAARPPEDDPAR